MSQRIKAIVEQGRLRPVTPFEFPEGTEMEIVIESVTAPVPKPRRSPEEVRRIVAEIAAMPPGGNGGDANAGRDGGTSSEPQTGRSPAEIIAAIAAQPMEAGGQEFSGRDHDRILYGEGRAR